jgi:hypothetical protein
MPSWAIYGNERRRGMHAEPGAVNLLLSPSAFDAADWDQYGLTGVTANVDGTGDEIVEGNAGDFHQVSQDVTKAGSAITYNLSVRAKMAGGTPRQRLVIGLQNAASSAGRHAVVDVLNGEELGVAPDGFGAGFSGGSVTVTSVGSGWFLCEFDGVTTDTDTTVKAFFALDAGGTTDAIANNYSGNGSSSMILDQAILVAA